MKTVAMLKRWIDNGCTVTITLDYGDDGVFDFVVKKGGGHYWVDGYTLDELAPQFGGF